MVALSQASKQMMEAVDGGEGQRGLGWSASGRSREEEDALMNNLKREAEILKEALNKRALLHMFTAEQARPSGTQPPGSTAEVGEGEAEDKDDAGREGSRGSTPAVVEGEQRGSVVLPRLRLELLPPPSPLSTATPGEVAASEPGSSLTSPTASSMASPLLLSTDSSPMASNLASPTDGGVFVFPKTPHRPPTLPPLLALHPPELRSPPSSSSPSSALAAAFTASDVALTDGSLPLPLPACLRPSTVTLAALPLPAPMHEPPPSPYLESLLLSLLSSPVLTLPLPMPARPPRKSLSLLALPAPRPPPGHPRHQQGEGGGRGMRRLRQRLRSEWEEEEREREEREERRRVEVRRRVRDAVHARMEEERRRREEEEAARRRREEAEREKAEAARLVFNFVNLRPLRPLQVRASTAAPTFITQGGEVQVGEGEVEEGEVGVGDERVELMGEVVNRDVWDARRRLRQAAERQRLHLTTAQGLRPPTARA